jgi:beta-aspartyl-peptidase (threonine type)
MTPNSLDSMRRSMHKKRPLWIAAALLILLPGSGSPSPDPAAVGTNRVERQIKLVLDAQVAAWNAGDLEGFMKGYWRSPELSFFSGANRIAGWEPTLTRYRQRYLTEGRQMGQLDFTEIEIELLGLKAAFVRGKWQLKMGGTDANGLFTLVLRKLPEGWKIVHDHTSAA